MPRPLAALLLLAPLSTALLAGCVDCSDPGPPVGARDIGPGTPVSGGGGPFELAIRVVDGPGGAPVPDAGVAVYWASDAPREWGGGSGSVRVGPSFEPVVIVEGSMAPESPEPKTTLRLRAGDNGIVVARVPANRVIGIVAAADGFTEEWVPAAASGDASGDASTELPLYRRQLSVSAEHSWGPGGASTGVVTANNYLWDPHPAPFGTSDAAARGYAQRLYGLRAAVTWSNGPTSAGDLAVALGRTRAEPDHFADGGTNAAYGEQVEDTALLFEDIRAYGWVGTSELYVGAASRTGYFGPLGLAYTVQIDAEFDTAAVRIGNCGYAGGEEDDRVGASVPGPGPVLVAAALAVALVVSRRRPPGR